MITTTWPSPYELLVEKDLNHGLDGVCDVNKFKELHQRRDTRCLLMLGRLVRLHLVDSSTSQAVVRITQASGECNELCETRLDVPSAHGLEHEYEQFLDRLTDFVAIRTGVVLKRLGPFERLSVCMDDLKCDVKRE